ncbi:MAG TPA: glycoside hydrolase family 16 protein [Polyangiaceae bacterium]|nr:glycoside hydrolase family 16 protein [Polyangiaceae bacterium]
MSAFVTACGSDDKSGTGGGAGALAAGGAGRAATGAGGTGGVSTSGGTSGTNASGAGRANAGTTGASGTSSSGAGGAHANGGSAGAAQGGTSATANGGRTGGRGGRSSGAAGASAGAGANAGAGTNTGGAGASAAGSAGGGAAGAPAGWTLSWSDEFDGPSGQAPDSSKWTYDVGGDGWGNSELEYYTDRTDNSATDGNGNLVITLKSETYMNRSYTSARLKTQGKFAQAYGRFEARIKIPRGQGVWPAFWMLGDDIATNPWPACGEIDIMENVGKEPAVNHGSMHGPGYSGSNPLTGSYTLMGGGALADDFHVYAIEWETNVVRFYVDDDNYETRKNTDVPSGATWVYDHPFFMILNIAIGGSFPGSPDSTTMLPQTMTVDYVRVYTKS